MVNQLKQNFQKLIVLNYTVRMIGRQTFETATKNGLGSVLKPLAKSLLMKSFSMPLGLTAAASATDSSENVQIWLYNIENF